MRKVTQGGGQPTVTTIRHTSRSWGRGAFIGLTCALVGMSTWAAEPTEKEMRTAVQAQFNNVNEGYAGTMDKCRNGSFDRNNPIEAMQCVAGGVMGNMVMTITTFHKIACEKAQGKAGYLCDYAMGYVANNPVADPYTRQPMAYQARLVNQGGRWLRLDQ